MYKRSGTHSGFTLIELLVVIAIIGILVVVVLVALEDSQKTARNVARVKAVQEYIKAIALVRSDGATYPLTGDGMTGTYRCLGDYSDDQCWTGTSYVEDAALNALLSSYISLPPGDTVTAPRIGGGTPYVREGYIYRSLTRGSSFQLLWLLEGSFQDCGGGSQSSSLNSNVYEGTLCEYIPD